jgi:membrane-bound ClpP family serine protease
MDWWLLLALFLYFACAFLIIVEIFVPSGGLISIISLACLVGGLWIFFNSKTVPGWWGIVAAFIEIPIVLYITYKIFPHTRFAKSVLLAPPKRKEGDGVPDTDRLKEMAGKTGEVITPLRPVGMVSFDGKRLECVAESGYVDKGKKVKVIKVESTQLTVRVVEE